MYMDNVVTGVADDKQAVHYYTHSRELLATAGMNLRQWTTNSKVLKQKMRAQGREFYSIRVLKNTSSPRNFPTSCA